MQRCKTYIFEIVKDYLEKPLHMLVVDKISLMSSWSVLRKYMSYTHTFDSACGDDDDMMMTTDDTLLFVKLMCNL